MMTQNQTKQEEAAIFLITKLLQKSQFISKDSVFEGLRKAGVPEDIIAHAWYIAVTETDV